MEAIPRPHIPYKDYTEALHRTLQAFPVKATISPVSTKSTDEAVVDHPSYPIYQNNTTAFRPITFRLLTSQISDTPLLLQPLSRVNSHLYHTPVYLVCPSVVRGIQHFRTEIFATTSRQNNNNGLHSPPFHVLSPPHSNVSLPCLPKSPIVIGQGSASSYVLKMFLGRSIMPYVGKVVGLYKHRVGLVGLQGLFLRHSYHVVDDAEGDVAPLGGTWPCVHLDQCTGCTD